MKVTVIGSGYVGTTTALVLAYTGHDVIGLDVDSKKVEKLNNGVLPFMEPGLDSLLQEALSKKKIQFTTDSKKAVKLSSILMIAVGTPSTLTGKADLTYVRQVLDMIAEHADEPKIVVTKSTVPLGTNRWIKQYMKEKMGERHQGISIISNPEFLREGKALHDSLHPARTVIGGEDKAAMAKIKEMYAPLPTSFFTCSYETAELIKYASNGFLATKISYINEIARLADEVGADIEGVVAGMGMDPRITPSYMQAGLGYGGSCFPKDVDELIAFAKQNGVGANLLEQVKHINETQISWFVRKMEAVLELKGKKVLVLGVAFKEDTDDQRESAGIRLIEHLLEKGVDEITIIDPTVFSPDQIKWTKAMDDVHKQRVKVTALNEEAADGIHAVLLATPWPAFKDYPWQAWGKRAASAYLFDGRNFLDPEQMRLSGWHYSGVARRGQG
ncbi:UDP-glucose dehydrogenase family protein [Paenibacillus sp. GXUN7292]|uniref:UDP-glucose dehydrogenase family protein n=1 Tax=Paenibacillus sp. GXUN7292 TaxID=3422499 RepID=UPI003D7F0D05